MQYIWCIFITLYKIRFLSTFLKSSIQYWTIPLKSKNSMTNIFINNLKFIHWTIHLLDLIISYGIAMWRHVNASEQLIHKLNCPYYLCFRTYILVLFLMSVQKLHNAFIFLSVHHIHFIAFSWHCLCIVFAHKLAQDGH